MTEKIDLLETHSHAWGVKRDSVDGRLAVLLKKLATLLPEQAPLHAFVHHNTLHAFEDLPFETAVVEASKIFSAEPFQTEEAFAKHLESGRISPEDIGDVLDEMNSEQDREILFPGGLSGREFKLLRLRTLFQIPDESALRYLLSEGYVKNKLSSTLPGSRRESVLGSYEAKPLSTVSTFALESQIVSELWDNLARVAPPPPHRQRRYTRRRDQLLLATSIDTDEVVHPLMIRLCAAYLDQGLSYWPMPYRSEGFLAAVRHLYALPLPPPNSYLSGLMTAFRAQEDWSAEQTILWALSELEVENTYEYLRASLLALRGWAGMMHQLELHPEKAPVEAPPSRLADFLAVRLVFDVVASRNVLLKLSSVGANYSSLQEFCEQRGAIQGQRRENNPRLIYEAFTLAQHSSLDLGIFRDHAIARYWLQAVASFGELERRMLLHRAYERRHYVDTLDALIAHCQIDTRKPPPPTFQAAFCIDDREESLRRHLEECFPAVKTYGFAGFFGCAINFQGVDDIRPRPLCPVTIQPMKLISEELEDDSHGRRYRILQRLLGRLKHETYVGSKTLTRGSLLAALVGSIALMPLIIKSLFPRASAILVHKYGEIIHKKPASKIQVEAPTTDEAGLSSGYTVCEMTAIVESVLKSMGLTDSFCPIVLIVGHGSSSLNNPHKAAYDCGATGGGRGGPNARVFAAMANHIEVRKQLQERGIVVPSSTYFVGAFHNTCDDTVAYYDEELLPLECREILVMVQAAMSEACRRDAHERCRRFAMVPADVSPREALEYAAAHSSDLAEARPECGHATNSLCIVGRRERTRGLFLDRRAFLVSYNPEKDDTGELLRGLLRSVAPVGAGINLEYYFSFVDPLRYGCGTKLPHNITGLIGVMDGHATDLRTGLPWQMVEIHEPVRLLTIVEATVGRLTEILSSEPGVAKLVENEWIKLVAWDPESDCFDFYTSNGFQRYSPRRDSLPVVEISFDHYAGKRDHLPFAHVKGAFQGIQR